MLGLKEWESLIADYISVKDKKDYHTKDEEDEHAKQELEEHFKDEQDQHLKEESAKHSTAEQESRGIMVRKEHGARLAASSLEMVENLEGMSFAVEEDGGEDTMVVQLLQRGARQGIREESAGSEEINEKTLNSSMRIEWWACIWACHCCTYFH